MSKIEAVIFDWAGTTVDFGCFAPVQAFIEAFNAYGISPTIDEVRKPMGMLKRDHVKTMLEMDRISLLWREKYSRDFNDSDIDKIYEKSESGIIDIVHNFAEPKPFVIDTVNEIRKRGIKIGSTTGYTNEMMKIVTKKAAEFGYIPDVWVTPESVSGMGRPYPYMIYKNMELLKIKDAKNVVKFGDTVADIEEGKNAGVITVGVVEGSSVMALSFEEFNSLGIAEYKEAYKKAERTFRIAGADYIIPNFSEVLPLIEYLNNK